MYFVHVENVCLYNVLLMSMSCLSLYKQQNENITYVRQPHPPHKTCNAQLFVCMQNMKYNQLQLFDIPLLSPRTITYQRLTARALVNDCQKETKRRATQVICRNVHKTSMYMIVNDRFIAFFVSIILCFQGQRCHQPIRNALKRSISPPKNTNTSCKPVITGVLCNLSANCVLFECNRSLFLTLFVVDIHVVSKKNIQQPYSYSMSSSVAGLVVKVGEKPAYKTFVI